MTKPKLLLADDSVTIRKVVELTFADEGIDVSTAGDANSAMQRFVEIQPDIVLVDVGLDGTNGYQICEMIKADEATKHIPVMLLVGSFEPFDHDEANRVGADGFLTKPFNSIRDLVGRVRMLLEQNAGTISIPENLVEEPVQSFETNPGQDNTISTPETEDIDYLYKSSFIETARIEELSTIDENLGDAGMDDEMIEASYAAPTAENSFADLSFSSERVEPTKEFDWSPESIVTEPPSDSEPDKIDPTGPAPVDRLVIDTDTEQADSGNILEDLSDPADASPEYPLSQSDDASMDTIEISHAPDFVVNFKAPVPIQSEDRDDVIELLGNDEDWTGVDSDPETSNADDEDLNLFTDADPAIHETIPYEAGEQPPVAVEHDGLPDISTELIEKIADRVIQKLSDSVVREIAKVEVPRIAEKLIREALEQEKKD